MTYYKNINKNTRSKKICNSEILNADDSDSNENLGYHNLNCPSSSSCSNLSKSNSEIKICNDIQNMQHERYMYKERMLCLSNMNNQLLLELSDREQLNTLMEQCLICPYNVKKGKVNFPGKSDLDSKINYMTMVLANIRKNIETTRSDIYKTIVLRKLLNILTPCCLNCSLKNKNYDN